MRYLIGSQIGWGALPVLIVAAAAYIWVAERLLSRKPKAGTRETAPSVEKAA